MFYLKHLYCGDYWDCIAKSGIYTITFVGCEHCYVGSAASFKYRWGLHRHQLTRRNHANIALQRAWDKYGSENIRFTILEVVEEKIQLVPREQFWMDAIQPRFNICKKAGSRLGMLHSQEARAKMSEWHAGHARTSETIAKWREAMIAGGLFACTPEKRAKITGQKRSLEVRARMSAIRKGWIPSLEVRRKISQTKKSQHLKVVFTHERKKAISVSAKIRETINRVAKYGYSPDGWDSMDLNAQLRWKRANRHLMKS